MRRLKILLHLIFAIFAAIVMIVFVIPGYIFGLIRISFCAGMELADEQADRARRKEYIWKSK